MPSSKVKDGVKELHTAAKTEIKQAVVKPHVSTVRLTEGKTEILAAIKKPETNVKKPIQREP